MTSIPTMVITPSAAADAYSRTAGSSGAGGATPSFGAAVEQALTSAVRTGHQADKMALNAIAGHGNLTDVVTALSRAELTLQTATAIRDRVIQAYQNIMQMPI